MIGRPSDFTPERSLEICEWLANGKSLLSYCEVEGNPSHASIYRWLEKDECFRAEYARAREVQAHADAERLNRISEAVQAGDMAPDVARVMADILKWTAARRAPKSYGDKVQLSGSDDGAPIVVTWAKPQD